MIHEGGKARPSAADGPPLRTASWHIKRRLVLRRVARRRVQRHTVRGACQLRSLWSRRTLQELLPTRLRLQGRWPRVSARLIRTCRRHPARRRIEKHVDEQTGTKLLGAARAAHVVAVRMPPTTIVDPASARVANVCQSRRVEAMHDLDAAGLQHSDRARTHALTITRVRRARARVGHHGGLGRRSCHARVDAGELAARVRKVWRLVVEPAATAD